MRFFYLNAEFTRIKYVHKHLQYQLVYDISTVHIRWYHLTVLCACDTSPHLPVTPVQLLTVHVYTGSTKWLVAKWQFGPKTFSRFSAKYNKHFWPPLERTAKVSKLPSCKSVMASLFFQRAKEVFPLGSFPFRLIRSALEFTACIHYWHGQDILLLVNHISDAGRKAVHWVICYNDIHKLYSRMGIGIRPD